MIPGSHIERFWAKVDKSGDCWEWTAHLYITGYGCFHVNRAPKRANRIAWELSFGEIPEGLFVCHTCDNRKCVRPSHLFLGTRTENYRDAINKGRWSAKLEKLHAGNRKFTDEQEKEIAVLFSNGTPKYQLARQFGVAHATIVRAIRRAENRENN